ncbi:DUF885 domain-containing protein [Novosphingobium sp.]|uniref:DUF885 domain-containing protein n=1 Tax=Novosphingobium sp. TaxID=1874826 RepID=UPI00286C938C|nr:DUF885 domain-containing protein [Novosphingobium sp.]
MDNPHYISRRQSLALLGGAASSLALTGCQTLSARAAAPATAEATKAAALLELLANSMIALNPEQASSLGVDTGANAHLRARLGDRSQQGQAQIAALLRMGLQEANQIEPGRLDAATGTSIAVVKSAFSAALDGFALPYGDVAVGGWRNTPYVVIQNVGGYIDIPRFLDSEHRVENAADAEAYLARLAQFPALLDGELGRIRDARSKGLVPPAFLLDKAIRQMELTLKDASTGGGLVNSLVRRTKDIPGNWDVRARTLATGPVAAALSRQLVELKAQRAIATMDAGLLRRPHGEEWYAWGLRASTTTRHSPEEIHAMGLDSLKDLQGQMDPILRSIGYTKGTVGQRMTALGNDPRFGFTNDDAGRAEIIKLMQDKIAFIRTRLPQAFGKLMPGKLEIRRLPLAEEDGAPGAYGGAGSKDGTVPGKIWLNLGDVNRHSRYSLATLAFHEGIPGHVWQGEYANALPLIRTLLAFNAYSEGWALYAETLGDELGAYEGDPVGRLGYLQSIAFRACRLVVDTGLHAKGWSREQAIQWFAETNGSGLSEVTPEVDRYCSWPGQACGYKVGHSEILAQRARAKGELAARYDLRDFDDAVVGGGNVPLDVLGSNVSRYIAEKKAG